MYFNDLSAGEAVKIGDSYVICLSYGEYLSPDGLEVKVGYGQQYTTPSLEGWKRIKRIPAKTKEFVFEDGSKHGIDEYNDLVVENNKYWDDEAEDHFYPNIDVEFEIKKELDKFHRAEKVRDNPQVEYEDVEIKVVGCSEDSGSDFIKSPILLGQIKWSGQGVWKVEQGKIAKDEFKRCSEGEDAEVPNHSNIEYVKIKGSYVFTKDANRWVKDSEAYKISETLEAAKEEEKSIREYVRKMCELHIHPQKPSAKMLKDIHHEIEIIENLMREVSAKQASSGKKQSALKKISELKESLL